MRSTKNILIGALILVVIAMGIGYAALVQNLNINGTAQVTSNWNIELTSISNGTPVGGATNNTLPKIVGTTASFDVNLVSPGDSMTYNVVVSNTGTLDAVLDDIVVSNSGSPAIIYTVTGVAKGAVLLAGSTNTVTVKAEYDSSVTSQPTTTNKTLTVTLNYVQKTT
jgi:hypothetical protein